MSAANRLKITVTWNSAFVLYEKQIYSGSGIARPAAPFLPATAPVVTPLQLAASPLKSSEPQPLPVRAGSPPLARSGKKVEFSTPVSALASASSLLGPASPSSPMPRTSISSATSGASPVPASQLDSGALASSAVVISPVSSARSLSSSAASLAESLASDAKAQLLDSLNVGAGVDTQFDLELRSLQHAQASVSLAELQNALQFNMLSPRAPSSSRSGLGADSSRSAGADSDSTERHSFDANDSHNDDDDEDDDDDDDDDNDDDDSDGDNNARASDDGLGGGRRSATSNYDGDGDGSASLASSSSRYEDESDRRSDASTPALPGLSEHSFDDLKRSLFTGAELRPPSSNTSRHSSRAPSMGVSEGRRTLAELFSFTTGTIGELDALGAGLNRFAEAAPPTTGSPRTPTRRALEELRAQLGDSPSSSSDVASALDDGAGSTTSEHSSPNGSMRKRKSDSLGRRAVPQLVVEGGRDPDKRRSVGRRTGRATLLELQQRMAAAAGVPVDGAPVLVSPLFRSLGARCDTNIKGLRRAKKTVNMAGAGRAKASSAMEDSHLVAYPFDGSDEACLLCVFDGHVDAAVAKACPDMFAAEWKRQLVASPCAATADYAGAFRAAYAAVDSQLLTVGEYSGATATTVFVWLHQGRRYVQCANVGDSSAFISASGDAVQLSAVHKLTEPEERARVRALGVDVADSQTRIAGLGVSRALGDHFAKAAQTGFSGEPFISAPVPLSARHGVLLVASDGLWDVLSGQQAVDLALKCADAAEAATGLLSAALSSVHCVDNVTVLCADLRR